ncbi:PurR: transcription regulator associated with purine metabolism [Clostridiaceae bacterium JG1575]|nr:PurR: transcription regulator associated with purine metabolism [Clostridiaceae bacterium JG1575]
MDKISRNTRISIITKTLLDHPNRIISLNSFAERFGAAKSTISEDLVLVRDALEHFHEGRVETMAGASGGVKYLVEVPNSDRDRFLADFLMYLKDPSRIVPGNFLYVTDLMQNPRIMAKAGAILSACFQSLAPDYIITVETKGIPLAYEVARCLGVGLIVVRRNTKITEGTAVSINYLTGNQGMLSVMSLSKRSIRPNARLLFIDDFLRGGGTVRGIKDLLSEFESTLLGVGVMVDNKEIEKEIGVPLINFCDYYGIEESGKINIKPSKSIVQGLCGEKI